MQRREFEPLELAGTVIDSLKGGILLNTQAGETFNSMVICWGSIGIEWGRPIFVTYVREDRYTNELLEKSDSFTISAARGALDPTIFKVCGSESGRDVNKVEKAGLTLVEPIANGVPAVAEAPITLECKIIYRRLQDSSLIPEDILDRCYPNHASGCSYHVAYYGQIIAAYELVP